MKLHSIILAVLILGMALSPCSDAVSCESIEVSTFSDHDHSEDQEDACAPFCVCQCCGITINIAEVNGLEINMSVHNFLYTIPFNFTYAYDYQRSAWHPPATA